MTKRPPLLPACGGMGLRQGAEQREDAEGSYLASLLLCISYLFYIRSFGWWGTCSSEHCSISTLKTQALDWLTVQPSTWLGELHQGRKRPFRMREVGAEGLDSWAFPSSPTSTVLSHPLSFLPSFYDVTSRHRPLTLSSPAVCSSAS